MYELDTRPTSSGTTISLVAATLLGFGVVMVFSASASLSGAPVLDEGLRHPAVRQATFSFVALLMMLLVGLSPYRIWRIRERSKFQPAIILMLGTLVLLVLVLVPWVGEVRNGARRWLSLGPAGLGIGFQPSEIAKLAIVVTLAGLCSRMGDRLRKFWTGFLPTVTIVAITAGLIGVEDFGTAALLVAVTGGVLLASSAKLWHIAALAGPVVAGLAYFVTSRSYRVERLLTFLDPYADPQGRGYHQIQSLITIASGGWWGRGLGGGIQKYGYLPEGRSDFIFAVICEEAGVIGGAAVIGLFLILVWQGHRVVAAAPDEFGRLLALGATLMIGLQAAINVAVVTVSVPTKGIALPLISAGGTGAVVFGVILGLLVNVARHGRAGAADPGRLSEAGSGGMVSSPATVPIG